jgi:tyrosine-protein phosphatase SIW14
MKTSTWILSMLLTIGLCGCWSGCTTTPTVVTHGVPNFYSLDGNIYRGGQPTTEGWAYLKSIGVTNVVKLNEKSEAVDKTDLPVNYYPINVADQVLLKPSKKTVDGAVSHITPNTYVHCEHGQDRTGLIIGVYRVTHDHWSKEKAYNEMIGYGFHKSLHGLNDYWEDDVK